MNEDLQEKLEKYLAGTLSLEEISSFEEEITTNEELAAQLQLQFQAQIAVEQAGDGELKDLLNKRGHAQFREGEVGTEPESAKVVKPNFLSRPMTWLAIAAAIALLVSLAILLNPAPASLPDLYAQNYTEVNFPAERSSDPASDTINLWSTIQAAYDGKDYAAALLGLDQMLSQRPDGQAFFFKGICLLKLQRPLEAVEAFEQVPDQNLDSRRASWYKALAYLQADDLEQSKLALKEIADNEAHSKRKQAQELLEMIE